MSITYELTEDEFEAVRDAKDVIGLVESLACSSAGRVEISRAELCAFTSVVLGKLRAVLNAAEERREAELSLARAPIIANAGGQSATPRRGKVAGS